MAFSRIFQQAASSRLKRFVLMVMQRGLVRNQVERTMEKRVAAVALADSIGETFRGVTFLRLHSLPYR